MRRIVLILLIGLGIINAQNHFMPIWSGIPYQVMNIYLVSVTLNDTKLENGDEIGVFDGDICVGVIRLSGAVDTYLEIKVSKDDPQTGMVDGFVEGNEIQFRLWKANQSKEIINVTMDYDPLSTSTVFTSLSTAFVNLTFTDSQSEYTVITISNPTIGGTTTGDGIYHRGDSVTVIAAPNYDWNFVNWTEDGNILATELDYEFEITSNRNITANFQEATGGQDHFVTVWSGTPYQVMNIYLEGATLDNNELSNGDEIGVFDGDKCVGAIKLNGAVTPYVEIKASKDNPQTGVVDGFTEGNEILFKLWDNSSGLELDLDSANYVPSNPTNFVGSGTTFVELFFTQNQAEYINLLQPNGSELWEKKTTKKIIWEGNILGNIKLEYSVNGGNEWTLIAENVNFSTGGYNWLLPDRTSNNSLIRITSKSNEQISDQSDNLFTIYSRYLRLVSPSGGNTVYIGQSIIIEWYSSYLQKLDLFVSLNGGLNWREIVNGKAISFTKDALGTFAWMIDSSFTSRNCLIKVVDHDDFQFYDVIDSPISILVDGLLLNSPNGGEQVLRESQKNITWAPSNVDFIDIMYTVDFGNNWTIIENSFDASLEEYSWFTPDIETQGAAVKLVSSSDEQIFDVSDSYFTITNNITNIGEPNLPSKYSLLQNYPNPFNPITIIEYQIPKRSDVSLKVYDILGRELITLVDGIKGVGNHVIEFNASQLNSGIYLYKLQTSEYIKINKMILVK